MKTKKIAHICTLMIFIVSCTIQKEDILVTINGEIISGNVTQVKFEWIRENPISGTVEQYIAEVDSNFMFSIEIPIKRLATARLTTGEFYHDICLLPGDYFFINVDSNTVSYTGKGAEKNNFLYSSEKSGVWNRAFNKASNKGELSPTDFLYAMKDFKQKRFDFLDSYPNRKSLEKEFIEYYKIETQVVYEKLIQGYPRRYAYKTKIHPDSLQLPDEYKKLKQLSSFMDDEKIISFNYIHNLRNFMYRKASEISQFDSSLIWQDAIYVAIFDSLQGKTKEYVLAKWICTEFSRNRYDTIAFDKFQEIEKDELSGKTVEAALNKYNEKQALIGKPLHSEFAQTILSDTANVMLTFEDMMSKYKGSVVYIDIWGLGCGPCRAAMPYSNKLKEKLADLPVEFVYLTTDRFNKNLWNHVFNLTLTKENHYRLTKEFNARFLKFMEIHWVPCYMIFDKNGDLIDFNADRPSKMVELEETELEKTLKQLAEK